MTWACLMKPKREVNLLFQNFHKMVHTQFNTQIRVLYSDNKGEYKSSELQQSQESYKIIHKTTYFDTPQQNRVMEKKIDTY